MTDCNSCQEAPGTVEWRDRRWCPDCFAEAANSRDAHEDWIRRILGKTAKPTFEPPVDATALGLETRIELLEEHTVLDGELAEVRALRERGLSDPEVADYLDADEATVGERSERIGERIERAENTVQMLE